LPPAVRGGSSDTAVAKRVRHGAAAVPGAGAAQRRLPELRAAVGERRSLAALAGVGSWCGGGCLVLGPRAGAAVERRSAACRVAVHLVDATSGFYEEHQTVSDRSHSFNRCASSARAVELVCIATAPGSVGKRDTARRRVIAEAFHGSLWKEDGKSRRCREPKWNFRQLGPWQTRLEMIRRFMPNRLVRGWLCRYEGGAE
jgi:hypothetical protein